MTAPTNMRVESLDDQTPGKGHLKSQSSMAFDNQSSNSAANAMRHELSRLADTVQPPEARKAFMGEMDNFLDVFSRYLSQKANGTDLLWDKVESPSPDQVIEYSLLPENTDKNVLSKLAILKLNGGLGTTMGCVGPKSMIEVREGQTFLDMSVRQVEHINRTYDVNVPFVLMNSFNTEADTEKIIHKFRGLNVDIITFNQSRFPRIHRDTLLPLPNDASSPIQEWYPPGHGDVFQSLTNSGLLEKLIESGKEYLFVSNIDNLGAVADMRILQHMVDSKAPYLMELTNKTMADIKGGTIINYEGQLRLLEIAQVPSAHVEEFKSIKKFKYFNTNNIWLHLPSVKHVLETTGLSLDIIANQKTIQMDKQNNHDISVLQLETAIGAAIRHFKGAHGINVPRNRFLPVKTCSDLMLIKSDLYSLSHGELVLSPSRFGPAPLIKLGKHFKKVSDFQSHMPSIPKILELDHLSVTGNVNFGRNIVLKGTVIIVCSDGNEIDIPPGSVLENVVVTGNLKLLEH